MTATTLVELHKECAGYRAEAEELANHFAADHHRISNNPALTPTGIREALEPLHEQVVADIAALYDREQESVRTYKQRLERLVFGLPSAASNNPAQLVSYRDAQSRARELEDSDEANDLYQSALRSGDDVLEKAILEKALIRGWTTITEDHLQRRPSTRAALNELTALAKYTDNSLLNIAHYMPPVLSLPHSAGFPTIGGHTTTEPVDHTPDFDNVIAQRLGLT